MGAVQWVRKCNTDQMVACRGIRREREGVRRQKDVVIDKVRDAEKKVEQIHYFLGRKEGAIIEGFIIFQEIPYQ